MRVGRCFVSWVCGHGLCELWGGTLLCELPTSTFLKFKVYEKSANLVLSCRQLLGHYYLVLGLLSLLLLGPAVNDSI